MSLPLVLRFATIADVAELGELYRNTILSINRRHYTHQQTAAWAARSRNTESLIRRIGEQHFLVAERDNVIAGFASITTDGAYLDFMYVHHEHQGTGVAGALYEALESFAREQRSPLIYSDVSKTARPFFEHKGFVAVAEQANDIDGEILHNYRMEKKLTY